MSLSPCPQITKRWSEESFNNSAQVIIIEKASGTEIAPLKPLGKVVGGLQITREGPAREKGKGCAPVSVEIMYDIKHYRNRSSDERSPLGGI